MTAVLAASLVALRSEINARWPGRDTGSDGWIGDARHAATRSEHNPDARGIVHALDVDVDGINAAALARDLIGDPRVWYVIWNRVIWSRTHDWAALRYAGADPHTGHLHVSIRLTGEAEQDLRLWLNGPAAAPKPKPAKAAPAATVAGRRRPTLARGDQGPDVLYLQKMIGVDYGTGPGVFGPRTEARVRWYQRMRGLTVDGVVGPATWAQIAKMG